MLLEYLRSVAFTSYDILLSPYSFPISCLCLSSIVIFEYLSQRRKKRLDRLVNEYYESTYLYYSAIAHDSEYEDEFLKIYIQCLRDEIAARECEHAPEVEEEIISESIEEEEFEDEFEVLEELPEAPRKDWIKYTLKAFMG